MVEKSVLGIVGRYREALEAQGIEVDRIVLYGSQATGAAGPDSDIDLVVISKDFAGKGYWERIEVLAEALYQVFERIEAVAMTPEEWDSGDSFIAYYAREGMVL